MKNNANSKALLALTTAALALPGYAPKAQAWAEPDSDAGYRFTFYKEGDISAEATNGHASERYQVLSNQFHLLMPRGEQWDYSADVTLETMSGASPWYIVPGADNKPIQVMSGATIEDTRYAIQGRARQYREDGKHSFTLSVSNEKDYLSLSGGGDIDFELDSKRTTISAGALYSHDRLSPTDGRSDRFPNRIDSATRNTVTAYAGVSEVLNEQTVAQVALSYTFAEGYLSDPYKQAYVAGNVVPDSRPDQRNQFAVNFKLRQYWAGWKGALHLDARYFHDDWGVAADTAELGWYQSIGDSWTVAPSVRWYEQGHADFYRPYFTVARDDGNYTSDYRLSAFGALSYRLGVMDKWKDWSLSLSLEYYDSSDRYTLHSVDQANPGLVDFGVISASISRTFKF
jgi:hypothetical protein